MNKPTLCYSAAYADINITQYICNVKEYQNMKC